MKPTPYEVTACENYDSCRLLRKVATTKPMLPPTTNDETIQNQVGIPASHMICVTRRPV